MHQPDYRDHASGEFALPWVYLHAIKDYTDMAWHLERHPGVRAVVNLVPVLLDQLEDYADQFASGKLRDPLLRLLARDAATPLTRRRAHAGLRPLLPRQPREDDPALSGLQALYELFRVLEAQGRAALAYLSDQFFYDLLTWYHLAWTGETVRRESELVTRLMAIGEQFAHAAPQALFHADRRTGARRRAALRASGASGRIELSTTPHYHPLAPLLLDFQSAREAEPEAPLPESRAAIPAAARASRAHLAVGARQPCAPLRRARRAACGRPKARCRRRSLRVLARQRRRAGSRAASRCSPTACAPRRARRRPRALSLPAVPRRARAGIVCFFRDDKLSDRIGFEYQKWHGSDAAANFVGELEAIAAARARRTSGRW